MKIIRNLKVPTGNILIGQGQYGLLEFLSLGDYGADINLNQHKKVEHGALMPLTKKWVITISTQYGCSMGCTFCDVPKVGPGRNAPHCDLIEQVEAALSLHPDVTYSERLNIHFARMGEPTWNPAVIDCAASLRHMFFSDFEVHPVVSTMMPRKNIYLPSFLSSWMRRIKNNLYEGNAGLQLSINSTDRFERQQMFSGNACSLEEISSIMSTVEYPLGRKITLNFAVAGYQIDPDTLLQYFDPRYYICKLTPMHKTSTATENGIEGDYTEYHPTAHAQHEEDLKDAGYEVLTFLASKEEDLSRITCGNAILSGSKPLVPFTELR